MTFKTKIINNIKSPLVVIISAIFATFIFSFGKLFLNDNSYHQVIWVIDTSIYSYLFGLIFDFIAEYINKFRTIVEFSFYNAKQESNTLILKNDQEYKTVSLQINIRGCGYNLKNDFRIYEPNGMTLQIANSPNFISTSNGSYYELDLLKLIGLGTEKKVKPDLNIERSVEFQVTLDSYDSSYKDNLKIDIKRKNFFRSILLLSVKQKKMTIKC
ncbi:hypothetical protein CU024_2785 [Enterococcus faecium]|uniref:SMODS-associating 2TM beta-strand rich effector domain-containing protein n=3 Tax=Enterococcus TaxID=1350 RepID=A0AB36SCP7_9ENTE|nr:MULTISPECIES: hypothetical protein [Enterococcus]EOT30277.1 hypothetical protein OMS_02420 [Enterococcus durans ATCC 6056]EOU15520.1 hypothetical protein I571_02965 [Enterococcus durans ATCC 6056]KXS08595.1 hypothetical protein AUC59_12610 [Enterococcus faecium]MBK4759265.1 hypothetical protein [Enterococcus faecium]MBK4788715.1 hypothetical protein [Enterococcus faecium]